MERAKPSSIKRATALRYMGASGLAPDDATTALLDRAEEKILAAATPRPLCGGCRGRCFHRRNWTAAPI